MSLSLAPLASAAGAVTAAALAEPADQRYLFEAVLSDRDMSVRVVRGTQI